MKKIIISAVMVLALAGGSVFADTAQSKNTNSTKSTASSGMKKSSKKHAKTRHKAMKKTANSNR